MMLLTIFGVFVGLLAGFVFVHWIHELVTDNRRLRCIVETEDAAELWEWLRTRHVGLQRRIEDNGLVYWFIDDPECPLRKTPRAPTPYEATRRYRAMLQAYAASQEALEITRQELLP
jgi:hypothetical protein